MANKALLGIDPSARRKIEYAEEDGKTYIVTREDCSSIVAAAKAISELPYDKEFRPVALVPKTVLDRAILEGWFHDKAKWRAWMNDPDNRDFRIHQGRM